MATSRITAPAVQINLDHHLDWHKDVGDKMLDRHDVLLTGKDGDNGLCLTAKEHAKRISDLEKIGAKIDNFKWGLYAWAAVQLLSNLPKLIALLEAQK